MRGIRKILNSRSAKNGDFYVNIQQILGFSPGNIKYYQRAFIHASLQKKDEKGDAINYERLEFLGDAILGAVVAAHLFEELPASNEGYLTEMRSKIVSRETLNNLGKELNLMKFLKKEQNQGGLGPNVHGNLFEAFIGAIYMDKGYRACQAYIEDKVIGDYVDIEKLEGKIISYKSHLIEWCQKEKKEFLLVDIEDAGRETTQHFAVKLFIDDELLAKARSTSKKKAEEKAARRAYFALQDKVSFQN